MVSNNSVNWFVPVRVDDEQMFHKAPVLNMMAPFDAPSPGVRKGLSATRQVE